MRQTSKPISKTRIVIHISSLTDTTLDVLFFLTLFILHFKLLCGSKIQSLKPLNNLYKLSELLATNDKNNLSELSGSGFILEMIRSIKQNIFMINESKAKSNGTPGLKVVSFNRQIIRVTCLLPSIQFNDFGCSVSSLVYH